MRNLLKYMSRQSGFIRASVALINFCGCFINCFAAYSINSRQAHVIPPKMAYVAQCCVAAGLFQQKAVPDTMLQAQLPVAKHVHIDHLNVGRDRADVIAPGQRSPDFLVAPLVVNAGDLQKRLIRAIAEGEKPETADQCRAQILEDE